MAIDLSDQAEILPGFFVQFYVVTRCHFFATKSLSPVYFSFKPGLRIMFILQMSKQERNFDGRRICFVSLLNGSLPLLVADIFHEKWRYV